MKRKTRIMKWSLAVPAMFAMASFYAGLSGAEDEALPPETPAPDQAAPDQAAPDQAAPDQAAPGVDPSRVMGVRACLGCHGAETLSWMKSAHERSHLQLRGPNVKKYAEALELDPGTVRESQACIRCHATGQLNQGGTVQASTGVSCESCHGAAGGDDGWLNAHAVYGPNGTAFHQESEEHRKWRFDRIEKAGMVRSHQIYEMARKCLECHLVDDEALVNAGHKIGNSFDYVGQTTGELLHNFHEDQNVNAKGPTLWARRTGGEFIQRDRKKFVIGLLAEIEAALLAVSRVDDESDYSDSLIERAAGGWGALAEFGEELEDDFPGKLAEIVELLEEIEDLDAADEESREQAAEWAKTVGALAREYADGDGSSLEVLDDLLEDLVEPVGEVFERK